MIGERVSHLSVSSCVPAPRCTRDSTPRSAHGVPPPAAHGAALSAPHGVPPPAPHGVPPSASHGVPPSASHGASPPAPHCAATPLVWCYLRLVARRISPRCSPCRHVLPRPLPASERLNARSAINIYNQFVLFSLYTLPSSRMRGRVESKSGLRKLLVLSKQGRAIPQRSIMV